MMFTLDKPDEPADPALNFPNFSGQERRRPE
jgi:hypothetical protein